MTQVLRMKRKLQRGLCPYDDTIAQLKGGLQQAPKWLNSVRKYPPEKMWLTPGKIPRPSEFWNDRIRSLLLKNRRRPSWIPSLPAGKGHPQIANIMAGAQFHDAFGSPTHASDPDIEFAACQAWFMTNKQMNEEEAYEQARFRMRDLIKQKQRVWEVYRRKQLLSDSKQDVLGYKKFQNERVSMTESWINIINEQMKEKMNEQIRQMKNIHNSNKTEKDIPQLKPTLESLSSHIDIPKVTEQSSIDGPISNPWSENIRLAERQKQEQKIQDLNKESSMDKDDKNDNKSETIDESEKLNRFSFQTNEQTYPEMNVQELEAEKRLLWEKEKEFNKDWENQVKLLRFIEYTDYIAQNPHLGLSDPTELLLGLPKNSEKDKRINKRLLLRMAQKQKNLRYLKGK